MNGDGCLDGSIVEGIQYLEVTGTEPLESTQIFSETNNVGSDNNTFIAIFDGILLTYVFIIFRLQLELFASNVVCFYPFCGF